MRYTTGLLASVALIAVTAPALAQEGPIVPADVPPQAETGQQPSEADQASAQNAAADQGGVAEIVVTAQKREQRLQDVPVAVTALTADMLINRGLSQVTDVTRAVPSLTITQQPTPANSSINLRGIGTFAFSTGVEPSVLVVVDDVALLQQAQAFSGLTDIARLEVLRGPQGTLFGKAASAGVINIVSQEPTPQWSASAGFQATTDEQIRVDGSLSGPIGDSVGIRVNAFYDDRNGHIRNLTTGNRLNGQTSKGIRGRLDLQPIEPLKIALIASYSKEESNPARTWRFADPNARIFPFSFPGFSWPGDLIAPALVGLDVGPENFKVRQDVEPKNDSRQKMFVGRATLDLGFANLVSITSYQDWRFTFLEDNDGTDLPVVAFRPGGSFQISSFHARQFAQELRLVSTGAGPLNYLFGLYYANGKTDRDFERFATGPGASRWDSEAGTKSYAGFGQITYDVTPTTHLDGGIRFNREKIDVEFINMLTPAPGTPNASLVTNCFVTCRGNASDNQITYKATLRQDLADDVMVYASYATGYKGQGFDVSSGFTATRAANPVKPEHSKAYEIGLKSMLFDRKLQLNVAGFWTDYDDFQAQSGVVTNSGQLLLQLDNVGKLRSKGVEVELSARPIEALQIDASAAYTDAKIRSFPAANCYPGQTVAQGCVNALQDLSGSRLANAPKFKYTISGTYEVPLGDSPLNGFVQADWTHQSKVNFDLLGNPRTVQSGYGIFNASIGVEESNSKAYRVSLFINNLFNKAYAGWIAAANGETQGLATNQILPRDARRYFGVRARVRY